MLSTRKLTPNARGANVVGPSTDTAATAQPSSTPSGGLNATSATVWLIGIGGTWLVLTFLAEFDDTRELAVALAVVMVGSVLYVHGQQAFQNLGVI